MPFKKSAKDSTRGTPKATSAHSMRKCSEKHVPQNYVISKLSRSELEDKFFKTWESSINLKKLINNLNDEIKMLKTKLIRYSELSRRDNSYSHVVSGAFENVIEEQSYQIYILEKTNDALSEKLENAEKMIQSQCRKSHKKRKTDKLPDEIGIDDNIESIYGESKEKKNNYHHISIERHKSDDVANENNENIKEELVVEETTEFHDKDIIKDIKTNLFTKIHIIDAIDRDLAKSQDNSSTGPSKIITNSSVQTDFDEKTKENAQINEILSEQLAEEQMKVLKLQREVNILKSKNKILSELQKQIQHLQKPIQRSENIIHDDKSNAEIKIRELQKCYDESILKIKCLESTNMQYKSEIVQMQFEIDKLNIKQSSSIKSMKDASVNTLDLKKYFNPENKTNQNENKFNDPEKNESPARNKNELNNSNKTENIQNEYKSNNADEKEENDEISQMPDQDKDIESKKLEKNEKQDSEKEILGSSNKIENNFRSDDIKDNLSNKHDKSFDDATYDVSLKDGSQATILDSSDDTLSDGEIPNDKMCDSVISTLKNRASSGKSPRSENLQSEDMSEKAKKTLKAISEELERCKSLIDLRKSEPLEVISWKNIKYSNEKYESDKESSVSIPSDLQQTSEANYSQRGRFSLHIKTVNFSELAVSELMENVCILTWQFRNQYIAYTPLKCGSVLNVNFKSNISLDIGQDVINYFINDCITIEIHKVIEETSVLYAKCSLNLINILKSGNNKVNYSLELKKHDSSQECGMLFCWCQLTCDSRHLERYLP